MSTAAPTQSTPVLRTLRGVVVSAKTAKTVKVKIDYQVRHPKYGKYLSRRTVLQVHDETGLAKEGDTVDIAECRPMSKTKHHRLVKVITRGAAAVKAEEPSEQIK
jgi:small subunit ribosomal protein S17